MLLFRVCFYFSFLEFCSSFLKFYDGILYMSLYLSFPFFSFEKNENNFLTSLSIQFLYFIEAGTYAAFCALSNDKPFSMGVHFEHQQYDK